MKLGENFVSKLRCWKIATGVTILAPIGWLVLFYLFVLRARLSLGYWPRVTSPDPGDLNFGLHELFLWISVWIMPVCGLLWGIYLWVFKLRDPNFRWMSSAVAYLSMLVIFLFVVTMDPGGYLAWFAD